MFVLAAIIDLCVVLAFSTVSLALIALDISVCSSEENNGVSIFPIVLIIDTIVLSISSINTTLHVIQDYIYPKLIAVSVGFGCIACHLTFIVWSIVALIFQETCLTPETTLFCLVLVSFVFLIWSCIKLMTSIGSKLRF